MAEKILSASRIKTLESCSWIYYCKYILKLPDQSNSGSIMGSCCHLVFECLGLERRHKTFLKVKKDKTIKKTKSIVRLCKKFLDKNDLPIDKIVFDAEKNKISVIDLVDKMILAGINHDFKCKGACEGISEKTFDIFKEDGDKRYKIRGFIDKLFIFHKKKEIVIRDFKSSKNKFEGKDLTDNVQDLMYRLAAKHLYPEHKIKRLEFVFLQFENPVEETSHVCEAELEGFEYYLTEVQRVIDNFSLEDAVANLAADKGFLPEEEGFAGLLMCSRAKHPDQLKVNGEPYWSCPYKFSKKYYGLYDKRGELIRTSYEEISPKEGETVKTLLYEGCPAFKHLEYNRNFVRNFLTNGE